MSDEFKIKKKKSYIEKMNKETRQRRQNDSDHSEEENNKSKKKLQLPGNTHNIFEDILEDANQDDTIFQTIQAIIDIGNKELKDKQFFWEKRKMQLKISNLSEKEFRERESQIRKDEKEEIKDIKQDIIHKLTMSNIRGFESFDFFYNKNFKDTDKSQSDKKQLEKIYKARQLWVLEKLLNFSYFQKKDNQPEIKQEYNHQQVNTVQHSHQYQKNQQLEKAEFNKRQTQLAKETYEKAFNEDGIYQGREKKLNTIKLSKHIYYDKSIRDNMKKNPSSIEDFPQSNFFDLTKKEIQKIKNSKNHKTYYDEIQIKQQFDQIKSSLLDFYLEIKDNKKFDIQNLNDQNLGLLINACSFSLNSIHFKNKFHKQQYIISPNDLIYLINKILELQKQKDSLQQDQYQIPESSHNQLFSLITFLTQQALFYLSYFITQAF